MSYILKSYPIADLSPGMIVGETILTPSGKVVLEENKILTDAIIRLLVLWEIPKITIKIAAPPPKINHDSFLTEHRLFAQTHSDIVDAIKNAFDKIRYLKEIPLAQLEALANWCLHSLVSTAGVVQHLLAIQQTDDYTFRHSVNVSVVSGVIGKWLGMQGQALQELVLAGLLHDVGKTQIPLEILNKPGKLSEQEMAIMKTHAQKGFELLRARYQLQLSDTILLGIQQHHERIDGSGYPGNLREKDINQIAKIIAVADVHDAMTSNRAYRNAVTPFSVIAELSTAMFDKLSPEVCSIFLNNFSQSLIGCRVRLSDHSIATVVHIDRNNLEKPLVRTSENNYINLNERQNLSIVALLNEPLNEP